MVIDSKNDEIQDFVNRGNYHAAINVALSAMNACRREQDQAGVDHYLDVIQQVVAQLAREYGS